jgi:hypothetical protein
MKKKTIVGLIVLVAVAVTAMCGCVDEEPVSTHSLPNSEQVPSPTIKEDTFEKIEGLTAIRISGGTWDNWDADIENDGPVAEIVYLDAIGNIISDESTKKMPISADVKIYAGDTSISPTTKLVFSAHYTEDQIIIGDIYPKIRIPKEELSVNPSIDYQYGDVEVTIYTPTQGSFSDRSDFIVLYEE